MSIKVRPWETRAGDRILGMTCTVQGPGQYAGYVYADATGQQRYRVAVTFDDGRESVIPYADDSWVHVIRRDDITR